MSFKVVMWLWCQSIDCKLRRIADPGCEYFPPGLRGQCTERVSSEFVRIFRMQGFSHFESKGMSCSVDDLVHATDQVHFDAIQFCVPTGLMIKCVEIEIAIQLSVDARQQILVETGGHALRII